MMGIEGNYVTNESGMLSVAEMARGLSRIPRFVGQTNFLWTVADHLLVCKRIAQKMFPGWPTALLLHVMLHDAHEAMTGDIPTNQKTADMRALQEALDARVYASLGLKRPENGMKNVVKVIDEEALLAEARAVCPFATYSKIIEERGHASNPELVTLIETYIHQDVDAHAEWEAWVENAIRAVLTNNAAERRHI